MSAPALQVVVVEDGAGSLSQTLASLEAEALTGQATVADLPTARDTLASLRVGRVMVLRAGDTLQEGFAASLPRPGRPRTVLTRLLRAPEPGRAGGPSDNHPLRARFTHGSRATDLLAEPHLFTTGLQGAVLEVPRQGLAPWAGTDADGSSLLVGHLASSGHRVRLHAGPGVVLRFPGEPRPYSRTEDYRQSLDGDVPAWLDAAHKSGQVPGWVWQMVVRRLVEVTDADRGLRFAANGLDEVGRAYVSRRLGELLKQVGPAPVREYCASPLALNRRCALLAGAGATTGDLGQVVLASERSFRYERQVSYFFTGDLPSEQWLVDGQTVEPTCTKIVDHRYFDQVLVRERLVWLPKGVVSARVGGREVKAAPFGGMLRPPAPRPSALGVARRRLGRVAGRAVASPRKVAALVRPKAPARKETAVSAPAPGASPPIPQPESTTRTWLYADRHDSAGDNAEPLYRHAREHVPDVRHVFALERDCPDWQRLEAEGFDLVDIGSEELAQVWSQAENLLLSDIGDPLVVPRLAGATSRSQRVVFLQHGVTMRDMWRWLNVQRIDVLVTSTLAETRGITADHTSYLLTAAEVWPTGFPRHDALFPLLGRQRDRVLLAPTWSPVLSRSLDAGTAGPSELEAMYAPWLELAHAFTGKGLDPVLFAHPKLALSAPEWFSGLSVPTVSGREVPQALSRSWAVVSDRSSILDEGMLLGAVGVVWDPLGLSDADHYRERHVEVGALAAGSAQDVVSLVERVVVGELRAPEDLVLKDAGACARILACLQNTT